MTDQTIESGGATETAVTAGSTNRSLSRSAFKVTVGGLLSLVAGLASQIIIAAYFGAGVEMDAYLTALVVPVYLQAVLLGGLSFVFIPAFVDEETKGTPENAWALAGTFFWLTAGILTGLAVAIAALAGQVIAVSAPGYGAEKSAMAVQMLAVIIFSVPLAGLSSLTSGIENVRNRFFWPAAAVAVGSITNVVVLLLAYGRMGPMALAWGYLAAAAAQAVVTVTPVVRHGWKKLLRLGDRRVLEMGKLIAPFIIFGLLTRSTMVFERYFASGLPDGSLSYIGYAYKISNIFVVLLAASIASAIFPAMARSHAELGKEGLIEKTEYGLRLTLAVALPAVAIGSAAAVPLIGVLYERGAFGHEVTLLVSRIVFVVMLNDVLFRMVGNIVSRSFYVLKDTLTFSLVSMAGAVLYVLAGRVLVEAGGYVGLAWAQPIQAGLASVAAGYLLARRLKAFHLGRMGAQALLYAAASAAAYGVSAGVTRAGAALPQLMLLVVGIGCGGVVYLAILFWRDREICIAILEMMGVFKAAKWARLDLRRLTHPLAGK